MLMFVLNVSPKSPHFRILNGYVAIQDSMRTKGGAADVSVCYCTFISPGSAGQADTKPGESYICLHSPVFKAFH